MGEPAQHEPVAVTPAQLGRVDGQSHVREPRVQGAEGDAPFHPGRRGAQAVVDAVAEREVATLGAGDVEGVRVAEAGPILVRRRERHDHLGVSGNCDVPIRTSVVV